MNKNELKNFISLALHEDIGSGDITTSSLIGEEEEGEAELIAREDFSLAGIDIAQEVFLQIDPRLSFKKNYHDGDWVEAESPLAELKGRTRALLGGERVALNILQHLSGIATLTRRYVKEVEGTKTRILDTRKTLPGLRSIEKYAVRVGGGYNHRFGLYDGIIIKDNHIHFCGGIKEALNRIKNRGGSNLKIEVEVANIPQLREALESGVDMVMLDNFSLPLIKEALKIIGGSILVEVSGGIRLPIVRELALQGVDFISIGELTQSAPAVDISMEIKK